MAGWEWTAGRVSAVDHLYLAFQFNIMAKKWPILKFFYTILD